MNQWEAKKILVGIDNSEASIVAVEHLESVGIADGARVRLVHVEKTENEDGIAPVFAQEAIALHATMERAPARGSAADTLLSLAHEWQADLIAMGTNDRHGLERLLLGSVSQSVLKRAQCPVLILRKKAVASNILVCIDDSEHSAACLEWLARQDWAKTKNIFLFSISHKLSSGFSSNSVAKASEQLLRHQFEESRLAHLTQSWSELFASMQERRLLPFAVVEGEPIDVIIDAGRRWPIDLIVLGSHCQGAWSRLFHESVSESIAAKAQCSVLVVRGESANQFEAVRQSIADAKELAQILAEKPHPARVSPAIAESEFNGYFNYGF